MTGNVPSGQQAVEHCPKCGSVVENAAGIGPFCPNARCDVADNLLCVPTFSTAAPTAPNTAAGDKTSAVKQMERSPERWANMSPDVVADGSRAQVVYALKDAQHDTALLVAALATPPAPSVPWEEQAAQWLDREADSIDSNACWSTVSGAVLRRAASRIRALLSKPAKGE